MRRSEPQSVNRRHFLATGAAALVAGGQLGRAAEGPMVAIVRDKSKQASVQGKINAELAQKLVDQAVMTLAGTDDVAKAWGKFVAPKDKVAVKFNGLFAGATTHPEVVQAILNSLVKAGVDPANLVAYDRDGKDLATAGLTVNREGTQPRIYATDGDYGPEVKAGPVATRLSNIVLKADVIINVPLLKPHVLAGLSGALKNQLGSVPNASAFHPDEKKAQTIYYLADISALEPIKTKTRLCITDALNAQYDRGPTVSPRHRWDYCGIIASADPLALDTVLADVMKAKRLEQGLEPYYKPLRHLVRAAELGLGESDLTKINRVELEV